MLDNGRISSVQLLLILFMTDLATSFLFIPSFIAEEAGPDGWLSLLVPATVYSLAVTTVCVALAGRFSQQVFTEYLPQVLGRIPGKLLAAAFTLVLIHLTSVVIIESSTFIHTAFLRETPPLVLDILTMAVVAYGVYLGIEVIARQNELVFPIFVFSLSVLIALAAKDLNLDNFRPVLGGGVMPVLKGAMVPAVWRGEVFLILMLYPYLNQKREALKAGVAMVLMAAVFGTLVFCSTVGVFGSQSPPALLFQPTNWPATSR